MKTGAAITLLTIAVVSCHSGQQVKVVEGWPPFQISKCRKILNPDSLPVPIAQKLKQNAYKANLKGYTGDMFPNLSFKGVPEFTFAAVCNGAYALRYFWSTDGDRVFAGVQIWAIVDSSSGSITKIYMERLPYE